MLKQFLKKVKRIGYFEMERCRGRVLKENGAFCVFWATGTVLAARSILHIPTHSKESRHHVLPCPELSNCCHFQFLTRRNSMGRAEKEEKKKGKEKPSMVIRMNCLELDNQK